MSKCIFCNNEKDGPICKHCLAKGTTKASKVIKNGVKVSSKAVSIAIVSLAAINNLKGKKRS